MLEVFWNYLLHLKGLLFYELNLMEVMSIIYTIIGALIGGGIVNFTLDRYRMRKEKNLLKILLKNEIKMNLDVLDSEYVKNNPSIRHKVYTSFYITNSNSLTRFYNESSFPEKVIAFYSRLELLHIYDRDLEIADKLGADGRPEACYAIYKKVGETKSGIRKELITIAKEIISFK
jgi:hypothetical protein